MKRMTMALVLAALLCGCGWLGDLFPDSGSAPPARSPQVSQEELADEESGDAEAVPPLQTLTVTVPEGYTLARIGMMLEEMGYCDVDEFIQITQTADFSVFSLVAAQEADDNRCFRLEGYLFPDTYQIYASDPPEALIRRMLDHLETKVDARLRAAVEQSGYTFDQVLAMASIIEKEAFGKEQMPLISSVLHNRLDLDMQLQCDVTITYVEGAIKPFIDGDKDRYSEHYNTYKCPALPAGAICNPGLDAIWAAVTPAETDYLFFVTDQEQNYYYSATWEGHLENIETAGIFAGNTDPVDTPADPEPDADPDVEPELPR